MRKFVLSGVFVLCAVAPVAVWAQTVSDRQFWISELDRIAIWSGEDFPNDHSVR